jgi:hypothetical protein
MQFYNTVRYLETTVLCSLWYPDKNLNMRFILGKYRTGLDLIRGLTAQESGILTSFVHDLMYF